MGCYEFLRSSQNHFSARGGDFVTRSIIPCQSLFHQSIVELEFLFEVSRIKLPSRDVQLKVEHEIGVRVCDLSFPLIANLVVDEKWTRDPFDRTIVAQAKTNGLAFLVSADEEMGKHYPRTIW